MFKFLLVAEHNVRSNSVCVCQPQSSLMDLMDAVPGGPVDPWGAGAGGGGGGGAAAAAAPVSDPWQNYGKHGVYTHPRVCLHLMIET